MRVRIDGDCQSALAVRAALALSGIAVSAEAYGLTVAIHETDQQYVTVDGIDTILEAKLVNRIAALTDSPLLLFRSGGVQTEEEVRLGVPENWPVERKAAFERGVLQGVLQALQPVMSPKDQPAAAAAAAAFSLPENFYGKIALAVQAGVQKAMDSLPKEQKSAWWKFWG